MDCEKCVYVINVNEETFGFFRTEEIAKRYIEEITYNIELMLKDEKPHKRFFHQRIHEKNMIEIYGMTPGVFIDGSLKKLYTVTYVVVEKFNTDPESSNVEIDSDDSSSDFSSDTDSSDADDYSSVYESDDGDADQNILLKKFIPPTPQFMKYL